MALSNPSKILQEIYPKNSVLWKFATGSILLLSSLCLSPLLVCGIAIYIPIKKIQTWWKNSAVPSDRFVMSDPSARDSSKVAYTLTSQYVTMRDGTRIALDLYLPKNGVSFPCILNQSRYHRSTSLRWPWRYFANDGQPFNFINSRYFKGMLREGYAVVSIDVRGAGASFGSLLHPWNEQERQDSVEIIDWITRQPWSNSRVGLWGMSYEGTAAFLTASMNHPAVKACVPMFLFYDMYNDIASPGGIAQHFFTLKWQELTKYLDSNAFGKLPSMRGFGHFFFQGVTPASMDYNDLEEAIECHKHNWQPEINPNLNRDTSTDGNITPNDLSLLHALDGIMHSKVPMLYYTGWYDQTVRSSLQAFTARPENSKVIIGPWNHGGVHFWNPDTQNSKPTECDHLDHILEFFHRYLQPSSSVSPFQSGVDYFSLGDNRWRFTSEWPPVYTSRKVLYLSIQDEKLVTDVTHIDGGEKTWHVSSQRELQGVSRWQATIEVFNPIVYHGWEHANHVVFTSEPLETALRLVGTPIITLWLTSSAPMTADIFVYITALSPSSNNVTYVTEGHFRASHAQEAISSRCDIPHYPDPQVPRHTFHSKDQSPVNEATQVRFGVLPIAYRFDKGWQIQVRLSGHDTAHFVHVDPDRTMTVASTALQLSSISLPIEPIN